MHREEAGPPDADGTDEAIVASIDRGGAYERFVIADISRDDRWLGIRQSEALSLRAWQ